MAHWVWLGLLAWAWGAVTVNCLKEGWSLVKYSNYTQWNMALLSLMQVTTVRWVYVCNSPVIPRGYILHHSYPSSGSCILSFPSSAMFSEVWRRCHKCLCRGNGRTLNNLLFSALWIIMRLCIHCCFLQKRNLCDHIKVWRLIDGCRFPFRVHTLSSYGLLTNFTL